MKFNLLSLLIVVALFSHTCQGDLVDGLQGYWNFDGNGSDSSGNNRDLTINGGAGFSTGLFGNAVDFTGRDGSKHAIRSQDDSVFDIGSADFTMQLWVNYASTANEQILAEKWTGAGGPGWTLTKLGDNRLRFHFDGGTQLNSAGQTISTGGWNHFVARRSGTQFDLFLNDTSIISANVGTTAASNVSNPLLLGRRDPVDTRDFSNDSLFDEVAFWDRALTNAEVTSQYNGGSGRLISAVPEPSGFVMMGVLCFGTSFRRKRKA